MKNVRRGDAMRRPGWTMPSPYKGCNNIVGVIGMGRSDSWISKAAWAACVALSLAGCAKQDQSASTAQTKPRPILKANLAPARKQESEPEHKYKFRQLLSEAAENENRPEPGGPDKPGGPFGGYDPQRLAKASQVHEWWPVDGPESGFQVFLRSQWTQGRLNVNVLIVGPVVNINKFLASVKTLQVIILDPAGTQIASWDLTPADFSWVNNDGNSGTMVFKTQVEFPLEAYEQIQSWNFSWTYP